jgi:hypothetical protein
MSILRRSVMGYYSYGHYVTVLRSAVYRTETLQNEDGKRSSLCSLLWIGITESAQSSDIQ